MPDMDGMEVYHSIRGITPEVAGVIITGYGSMEVAMEAIRLGFSGFVTKPFAPEALALAVGQALARRRLERENARLRALIPLLELSRAFMGTTDLDELLNQVVHMARRETKADRVSLMLLDEASGELTIEAAVGLHRGVVATTREKVGDGIAGWVAKRGEPSLLNDRVPLDPKIREAMKSDAMSSALCVPLKVKDRVIGVLNLAKLRGLPFAEGDLEMVSILCGQAAIAIENARLYEEATERAECLKEANKRLLALQEAGMLMTSKLDLYEVLRVIRDNMAILLGDALPPVFALLDEERKIFSPIIVHQRTPLVRRLERITGKKLDEWQFPLSEMRPAVQEAVLAGRAYVTSDAYDILGHTISKRILDSAQRAFGVKLAIELPLLAKEKLLGVMLIFLKREKVSEEEIESLLALANQAAIAIENARLFEELRESFVGIIAALAAAIDAKDPYTRGHSERVARYAAEIARELGLEPREVETVHYAGLLHDIGKIGVSEQALYKPDALDIEEWETVKAHPVIGARILKPISLLKEIVPLVRHHHERYDGTGYPDGLAGEEIPLGARILAVADSFEVMTSSRPYSPAMPPAQAIALLQEGMGKQWDAEVVEALLRALEKERLSLLEGVLSLPRMP